MFFNELHFDGNSRAHYFNFGSPNHTGKKGVNIKNISPRHYTNPVTIPQLENLAPKNLEVLGDG